MTVSEALTALAERLKRDRGLIRERLEQASPQDWSNLTQAELCLKRAVRTLRQLAHTPVQED